MQSAILHKFTSDLHNLKKLRFFFLKNQSKNQYERFLMGFV